MLILSAKDRAADRLEGFRRGADDYVTKPFELPVLLAKIEAILRRQDIGNSRLAREPVDELMQFGHIGVDTRSRKVFVHGREVHLRRFQYRLFIVLIAHRGEMVTREVLCARSGRRARSCAERSRIVQVSLPFSFFGRPSLKVAVGDSLLHISVFPHDASSNLVYAIADGRLLRTLEPRVATRARLAGIVAWRHEKVVVLFNDGRLGVLSAEGDADTWTSTAARSIDAVGAANTVLSTTSISTPEHFGYWWYVSMFPTGPCSRWQSARSFGRRTLA